MTAADNDRTRELRRLLDREIAEAEAMLDCNQRKWDESYEARKRSEYWRGVRDGLRTAAAMTDASAKLMAESEG